MTEPSSFRVGIVGLSPVGRFLLERLSLWPDCESVLFPPGNEVPSHETGWHRFLFESNLKAVLFLDGDSLTPAQVENAFQAQLPVGLLPPFAWEPEQWQELTKSPGSPWFLLNPHHEDSDFRAALTAVQSGELGPVAAIKRISWVGDLVVPKEARRAVADSWQRQLLWEDVDQLLLLAGEMPETLFAAEWTTQPASYSLFLQFPSGLTAHLERRRGSTVPLEQGWTITGSAGGYANGHRHIKTDAGELYEVPVDVPGLEPLAVFEPLKAENPSSGDEGTPRHVLRILTILEAIKQSTATGQVVACHEP